jgi:transposase
MIFPIISAFAEEACFLWVLREKAAGAPHYDLKEGSHSRFSETPGWPGGQVGANADAGRRRRDGAAPRLGRIARELGVSRTTVKQYVRQGGWKPYKKPERSRALDEHSAWLKERLLQHGGNAEVVRQELEHEKKLSVSLRTVERAVEPYRQELRAEAKKTVRFETRPGRQLQVDFGRCLVTRR